jgi:hypothetical protein
LENKLGVVPLDAPVAVPNNPPPEVPLDAGCEPPRLPNNDDMVVVMVLLADVVVGV